MGSHSGITRCAEGGTRHAAHCAEVAPAMADAGAKESQRGVLPSLPGRCVQRASRKRTTPLLCAARSSTEARRVRSGWRRNQRAKSETSAGDQSGAVWGNVEVVECAEQGAGPSNSDLQDAVAVEVAAWGLLGLRIGEKKGPVPADPPPRLGPIEERSLPTAFTANTSCRRGEKRQSARRSRRESTASCSARFATPSSRDQAQEESTSSAVRNVPSGIAVSVLPP
mmetsp:Transcript_73824/g.148774  ORF Transcript_73824/g.148774 Transcript_73824/m.148774 type:complete len:225 (-) Transcript_73824:2091-2765(-)